MSSIHWTGGSYDRSTRGTAPQWPIPVKKVGLVKISRPAHIGRTCVSPFKPTAHTRCANSARQRPVKDLTPLQPIVSSSPLTACYIFGLNIGQMWFRPVNSPFKGWANFQDVHLSAFSRPITQLGQLLARCDFRPSRGPFAQRANS